MRPHAEANTSGGPDAAERRWIADQYRAASSMHARRRNNTCLIL